MDGCTKYHLDVVGDAASHWLQPVAFSQMKFGNWSTPVLVQLPNLEKIKKPVQVWLHQKRQQRLDRTGL